VPPRATGFGVGSIFGGWLLERADGHRIMAAAAGATTAVNLVMAMASSFELVLVMQLCYGLLGGCSEVVINTLTLQCAHIYHSPPLQLLAAVFRQFIVHHQEHARLCITALLWCCHTAMSFHLDARSNTLFSPLLSTSRFGLLSLPLRSWLPSPWLGDDHQCGWHFLTCCPVLLCAVPCRAVPCLWLGDWVWVAECGERMSGRTCSSFMRALRLAQSLDRSSSVSSSTCESYQILSCSVQSESAQPAQPAQLALRYSCMLDPGG
jgi:MFS family permease